MVQENNLYRIKEIRRHYNRLVVSRDGSRKRGGGNDTLSPVELKLSSSQKVTVRREKGHTDVRT